MLKSPKKTKDPKINQSVKPRDQCVANQAAEVFDDVAVIDIFRESLSEVNVQEALLLSNTLIAKAIRFSD